MVWMAGEHTLHRATLIDISPNTSLTLTASYLKDRRVNNSAFFSTYGTLIPVNGKYVSRHTNYGDPEHDKQDTSQFTLGWDFSHKFNDAWTYKNSFTFMHQDFYMRNTAAYNAWEGSVLLTDKLQRYSILNDGKTISFSFDNLQVVKRSLKAQKRSRHFS